MTVRANPFEGRVSDFFRFNDAENGVVLGRMLAFALLGAAVVGSLPACSPPNPESAARQETEGGSVVGSGPPEGEAPAFSESDLGLILRAAVAEQGLGAFPGAAIAVGRGEETHLAAFGSIGWTANAAPVDPGATLYDLASLTKVVATASAVMLLVDEGRMSLDDPASRFFPEFATGPKAAVTIRHLLTHTSGLPEGATLLGENRSERIARAKTFAIYPPSGARATYSDVGYILLWEAAEAAAGEPLTEYLERKLFAPLGMRQTRFSPGLACESCAPTGRLRDQSLFRGIPFDPLGQRLDGVTGSSGLFSTAHDLGRYMAMIANGGELDGVRIVSEEVLREFLSRQPTPGPFRLAWEDVCPDPTAEPPSCDAPLAIGHTGWTGTAIYLEPSSGVWLVLLTNRTYEPRVPNRLQAVRREMLTEAIRLGS